MLSVFVITLKLVDDLYIFKSSSYMYVLWNRLYIPRFLQAYIKHIIKSLKVAPGLLN